MWGKTEFHPSDVFHSTLCVVSLKVITSDPNIQKHNTHAALGIFSNYGQALLPTYLAIYLQNLSQNGGCEVLSDGIHPLA